MKTLFEASEQQSRRRAESHHFANAAGGQPFHLRPIALHARSPCRHAVEPAQSVRTPHRPVMGLDLRVQAQLFPKTSDGSRISVERTKNLGYQLANRTKIAKGTTSSRRKQSCRAWGSMIGRCSGSGTSG